MRSVYVVHMETETKTQPLTITSPLAVVIPADTVLRMRGSDAWAIVNALRAVGGEDQLADAIATALVGA